MSCAGGIITLSSSPPRFFARSPTPADKQSSSPALPSPAIIFASEWSQKSKHAGTSRSAESSWVEGRRRFKTTNAVREGFARGLGGATKLVLKEKPTKGNVPILRRGNGEKCEGKWGRDSEGKREPEEQKSLGALSSTTSQQQRQENSADVATAKTTACVTLKQDLTTQSETTRSCRHRDLSPLNLDKASARRLDWTPPTSRVTQVSPEPSVESFSGSLLGSFGYNAGSRGPNCVSTINLSEEIKPTKRRKIDVLETGAMTAYKLSPSVNMPVNESTRNRKKSPKKKCTTITALATSHYLGVDSGELSPMMQYLSATQQRAIDNDPDSVPGTAKRKSALKKARITKKVARKSTLQSPQSAMKTLENQDTLFGSASQLARDESPTLIRDTVQAIKHSQEIPLTSDPVSTQITIPTSEPAETPRGHDKRGVSRFVKTRNLWSAAGRDDDNALLQVDTVDMFDSPYVRTAFAGKDVLLEPGAPRFRDSMSPERRTAGRRDAMSMISEADGRLWPGSVGGELPQFLSVEDVVDIDDLGIKTPFALKSSTTPSQIRALHTAAVGKTRESRHAMDKDIPKVSGPSTSKSQPTRPSFKGFTTSQLASQLAAYGFKPIKKRETMIEVLDRCWDDKHGTGPVSDTGASASVKKAVEMSHSDFLSKVHDISARPTPKVKKPRGRPKKDGAASPEKPAAKKPRSKQSAETVTVDEEAGNVKTKKASKPAQSRVRKLKDVTSKSSTSPQHKTGAKVKAKAKHPLSEEFVVDIDDIEEADSEVDLPATEGQSDHTGVNPALRRHPRSLPPNPLSSDAFEAASWPEPAPAAPASKPSTKNQKASKPAKSATPKKSLLSSRPSRTTSLSPSPSPPAPSPTTITSTPPPPNPAPSPPPPNLSTQITLAITTPQPQPQPHNSHSNPTYHQRILTYTPLILEDLTTWLNTEGFKAIGEDREVSALDVRAWCEERGVCCLWRGGRRGRDPGRGVGS